MDKYISMEDAIEAVGFNPVYSDYIRACPAVEDKIDNEIRRLANHKSVDENIIKTAEECGELFQALSKWRDVMNDGESQPDDWYDVRQEVIEELADVIVMTRILRVVCAISPDEMWTAYQKKMKRNLERIGYGQ